MTERRKLLDRRASPGVADRQVRSIIEQLADGVVIVGDDGLIRFVNPSAAQLFGRDIAKLVGTDFGFAVIGPAPPEIELVRPDGQPVTAELRVGDVFWNGEPAKLISVRDITDRRRAEERARQITLERAARAEAEAANRAKSEFLATMSHELRTPLNAVIGYAQLLDLGIGGKLPPGQQQQVDRILASGQHLLALVNELLDLAKVDAGRLSVSITAAPARSAAEGAAALVQASADEHGITLSVEAAAGANVKYFGDEDRVRQILVNLLSNAVKFTGREGSVVLEYGETTEPGPSARLHRGAVWCYFQVADTGRGIPADQFSRIFERFVQVESGPTRSQEGSGLGLAISQRLARLMHGDITVQSTVGEGSTFTLFLPTREPQARPVEDTFEAPTAGQHLHGLGQVGEELMAELGPLVEAYVMRLRAECPAPGIADRKFSELADHVGSYLADVASMLVALDEAEGQPSDLLLDAAEIHRVVAARHGAQRAKLGWDEDAIQCEYRLLREEVTRQVRKIGQSDRGLAVDDAMAVITRLINQAEQISVQALTRTQASADVPKPPGGSA